MGRMKDYLLGLAESAAETYEEVDTLMEAVLEGKMTIEQLQELADVVDTQDVV